MNGLIALMFPLVVVLVIGGGWLAMADGVADRLYQDARSLRKADKND